MGTGVLTDVVLRTWDRLRAREGPHIGQSELQEALTEELAETLASSSAAAAGLRAEVAGVLQGVDAVKVALTTTIETSVQESGDQLRAVLIDGLQQLGHQFTEFGWLLAELSDQIPHITQMQAEILASSKANSEYHQQELMKLTLIQLMLQKGEQGTGPNDLPEITGASTDEERAAALDAAGVPVSRDCPYPGLAAFGPQEVDRFFGRQQLTAVLVTRLAEQLTRPGLLMVSGPSGSGKSSVLRAGLLPAIATGLLPARGSQAWPLELITPGKNPLLTLAVRIADLAGIPAGALHEDLCADPTRITADILQALHAHARRHAVSGAAAIRGQRADELDVTGRLADAATAAANPGAKVTTGDVASLPRLVLIIDQFEEIFNLCPDEQRGFIQALCAAAGTTAAAPWPQGGGGESQGLLSPAHAPALVVIGMRADFYASSAAYPELVPFLQDHQVLVGSMDQAGLRAAIEEPAASAGLVVDHALVEVLLSDLGLHPGSAGRWDPGQAADDTSVPDAGAEGNSGQASPAGGSYEAGRLPLLAYALQQTWQRREGRRLTVAGYRATGGIDGAVTQAADNVYNGLDPAVQDTLRRVLLRLVTLGEGTPDTRRRVTLAELTESDDRTRSTPTRAVLDALIDARLVTADEDTVEITHETLLTAWPRLRQWLTDDREGLRIHHDLTDTAREWQHEGRDPSRLYRGTRLAVAWDWAARHGQDLNAEEQAFLAASQHDQLRATRRRQAVIAVLAVLALVASIASVLAVHQTSRADQQRDQAIYNQTIAEGLQLGTSDTSLAAQLTLAAYRMQPTQALAARLLSTENTPLATSIPGSTGTVDWVAFSPDGRTLATCNDDGTIQLWDVAHPADPRALGQPRSADGGGVYSVAFSPDGRTLATGGYDSLGGTIQLWDVADPAHPQALGHALPADSDAVDSVAFSPDGRTLATGGYSGKVHLWDVADPAHPQALGQALPASAGAVQSVAFSPDGRTLVTGNDDGTIQLWDVANPADPQALGPSLTGSNDDVEQVAFSPDGMLATGDDGTINLWDVADPAHPQRLGQIPTGSTDAVYSVAFSPDGRTLAAGIDNGTIQLWDLADPTDPQELGQPLTASTDTVFSVAFSPDGHTLASGNQDSAVRLWNLPQTVLTAATDGVLFGGVQPGRPHARHRRHRRPQQHRRRDPVVGCGRSRAPPGTRPVPDRQHHRLRGVGGVQPGRPHPRRRR